MVISPLIPSILTAASLSEGAAAEEAETRNHKINDPKCLELGGVYSVPKLSLYVHLQMYMHIQSTMHQLAKLEIEAATSP